MEFKAHLTADAVVRNVNTKDGKKQVVSFRAGENNGYKSNGVWVEQSTFYNCSFWMGVDEAKRLKKGVAVIIRGALKLDSYTNGEGKVIPTAEVNVSSLSYPVKRPKRTEVLETVVAADAGDDLPF